MFPVAKIKTLKIWDSATGKLRNTLTSDSGAVYGVAISPDGKIAATGTEDHTIVLWDLATGKKLAAYTGHSGPVHAVAFSPDGKFLATGGDAIV